MLCHLISLSVADGWLTSPRELDPKQLPSEGRCCIFGDCGLPAGEVMDTSETQVSCRSNQP